MWFSVLIGAIAGYLLGNLNGAISMSVLVGKEDVRSKGSGNAGLTNFVRNYGAGNALFVILIDGGKALIACLTAGLLLEPYGFYLEGLVLGGAAVMLGHVFPALMGFRGGKGILSGLFIALTVDIRIGLLILAVFLLAYLLTQYVSLGSVLAAVAFGAGFIIFHRDNVPVMAGGVFMAALTIFMHRGNIVRLLKGQERKTKLFGKGRQK